MECGSAECGVRSAECGVRSAECGVRNAEWTNEECNLYGVGKTGSLKIWRVEKRTETNR